MVIGVCRSYRDWNYHAVALEGGSFVSAAVSSKPGDLANAPDRKTCPYCLKPVGDCTCRQERARSRLDRMLGDLHTRN